MVSKNRVALVTGAGRNLGREIALALGRSGAEKAGRVTARHVRGQCRLGVHQACDGDPVQADRLS